MAVIDANPANYQSLAIELVAGDTLRLASGTYTRGLSLTDKAGTAAHPIIVMGPDDQSAVFLVGDCCNTIQLDDASNVRVLNLTLNGGGHADVSAVDSRGSSHDVTLENLKIIGYSGSAQAIGISTHGSARNWIIRHNLIVGANTGLLLGTSDGMQAFVAGLIEHNSVLDTVGSSLEIDALQAADSSSSTARTVIRYNVFSKQNAALTSETAHDSYDVYGNFVYQKTTAMFEAESYPQVRDRGSDRLITVAAVSGPSVTINASPSNVSSGGTSVLSWTSTGVDACSASGGWSGTKPANGSATVGPLTAAMSYQLTCLGAAGNANAITTVTVGGSGGGGSPPPSDPTPPANPSDPSPPSNPSNPSNPTQPSDPTPPSNPPSSGSPSDMAAAKSGGGGRLDGLALLALAVIAVARGARRRSRAHPRARWMTVSGRPFI